jgi:transposase
MRVARKVELNAEDRAALEQQARARSLPARLVERSRIVLRAADGLQDREIAAEFGITPEKVARWRNRFLDGGRQALIKDAPRPGRTRTVTDRKMAWIVKLTTSSKPANATHWSTRSMAERAGVSEATVRRIWRAHGLKPHLSRTFKVSQDPQFAEKLADVVGLYLNPPEHAIVLSVDEKSQIQALDRTQPGLPLKKGRCGTMTHDYRRNGTATLFAALDTLDGRVISMCDDRHRHQEWLRFLRMIDKLTAQDKQVHLIVDNYATHKHAAVKRWLGRHKRFHVHFTPTSCSWLNMVERFFRDLTEKQLRRGSFSNVEELLESIGDFIDNRNRHRSPSSGLPKLPTFSKKSNGPRPLLLNRCSA